MAKIALWDFNETDAHQAVADSVTSDGTATPGQYDGTAKPVGGNLVTDGKCGWVDIDGCDYDGQFDLATGTIVVQFTQDEHPDNYENLVTRGEYDDKSSEGYFEIKVTDNGAVTIKHYSDHGQADPKTPDGFFSPGDDVRVEYSWDETTGAKLTVSNLTTGETYVEEVEETGLTFDIGDNDDESFVIGAREKDDGEYDQVFDGKIAFVEIYDTYGIGDDGGDDPVDPPVYGDLIGFWDFNESDIARDTGLGDGVAQDGTYEGGAFAAGGALNTDGHCDHVDVSGDDDPFDLASGTIEVAFTQDSNPYKYSNLVTRGEYDDKSDEGYFEIKVTENGAVKVKHYDGDAKADPKTPDHFFATGDEVRVTYSWDESTGAKLVVENLTTGDVYEEEVAETGLTFDIGDNDDENFVFAAREKDDGEYDRYFDGKIDYVKVYNAANPTNGDGIVEGTAGDDLIDAAYTGDPEGDMIDANDALGVLGTTGDQDVVTAGAGDDTVIAGADDDIVFGEAGADTIYGDGGPQSDNLILNGSFEDVTGLTQTGYGFRGDGAIPNWTADPFSEIDIHNDGRGGVPATDGNNWLDLEASPGNARIGQDVAGVQNGEIYTLTFDAGDGANLPGSTGENLLNVYWGGELVGKIDPPQGGMQTYTFEVTGGAGDGTNRLEFEGLGSGDDNFGASVDSVSLVGPVVATGGDDILIGGTGNDVIFGEAGDDLIIGGDGSDTASGGLGDDILIGDGGNTGAYPVTLTFEGEEAGYLNTIGIYTINPATGEISNVEIAFENASADGSGGTLQPGDSYTYLATPGTQIGVFNIAQGASLNDYNALGDGTFKFVDDFGNPATVDTATPTLIHVATDGTITELDGLIYHTAGFGDNTGLNPDGLVHTVPTGGNGFGIEDLQNLGDADYDDPLLSIDLGQSGASFDIPGLSLTSDLPEGAAGDDVLLGNAGDDIILGGAGDDAITGGAGADILKGGDDRDTFYGGTDGDVVDGGSGGDDFDVLDLTGSGPVDITYTSPDQESGFVTFGGDPDKRLDFTEIEKVIPCFTPGTAITTPRGEIAVEDLKVGDKVITRDNGFQTITWIGHKQMDLRSFTQAPQLRPILIRAGALGNDLPERDLILSPNHRVLITEPAVSLYFDEPEVLVAAKHLVGRPGIHAVDMVQATYIHFMFDRHEVVLGNGVWSESFQPGDYALKGIDTDQRAEIFSLFPELKTREGREGYRAARPVLKAFEAKLVSNDS